MSGKPVATPTNDQAKPELTRPAEGFCARRNLVYTSAGDHHALARWVPGDSTVERSFDLWVTYYGNRANDLTGVADFYNARAGSKFSNLKYAYRTWPETLAQYDAILVLDDDIEISHAGIDRLFEWQQQRNLWLLQPAINPLGKVSWPITRADWACRIRFTNFVEMNCPLFRRDKLDAFMAVYDEQMLSWSGIDYWYMHVLAQDATDTDAADKIAIIDEVVCVNPHDRSKGGVREVDRQITLSDRLSAWQNVKSRYGIERKDHREYSREEKTGSTRLWWTLLGGCIDALAWLRERLVAIKNSKRRKGS